MRRDRVAVVVEPNEAGFGHRRRHSMKAIEPAAIGHQAGALGLKHRPDRLVADLGMAVCPGIGHTLVQQPGVQLVEAFDPQPRGKEPLADQADLVLDLALLPARGRGAGHRIHQVMAAHLQEPAIVGPLATDKDRVHRGFHVVVDAARASALEERKAAVVGVKPVDVHVDPASHAGRHERTAFDCGTGADAPPSP